MAPLFPLNPTRGRIPAYNSACPWATTAEDLRALYLSPWTCGVTTRTTTLHGFPDDPSIHQVAFFGPAAESTINCFGYSPYPIATYLDWLRPLLLSSAPRKPVVVSITGTEMETAEMLSMLQAFADETKAIIGAEFNASCPNIPGHPPPAYVEPELSTYVKLLASYASPNLMIGIKLPPYTYESQFASVVSALSSVSSPDRSDHPISFLCSTNTLGQGFVFAPQVVSVRDQLSQRQKLSEETAVPGGYGGLAGAAIHQLSLGNIKRLSTLLVSSKDPSLRTIALIGVGGVTDAESAERYRRAGASAVACATALGRDGTEVFERIASGQRAKL